MRNHCAMALNGQCHWFRIFTSENMVASNSVVRYTQTSYTVNMKRTQPMHTNLHATQEQLTGTSANSETHATRSAVKQYHEDENETVSYRRFVKGGKSETAETKTASNAVK